MSTATKTDVDALQLEWEQARDRRNAAAVFLAYDLVIRAEDRYANERPTPEHVEELKVEYRAAHDAEVIAREKLHAAW